MPTSSQRPLREEPPACLAVGTDTRRSHDAQQERRGLSSPSARWWPLPRQRVQRQRGSSTSNSTAPRRRRPRAAPSHAQPRPAGALGPPAHLRRRGHPGRRTPVLPLADDLPARRTKAGASSRSRPGHRHRQMSDGGKTWKFTLKDGVKWQDGKPITCEDFKYGVSRDVRHRRHHRRPELHRSPTSTSRRRRTARRLHGPVQEDRARPSSTRPSPATGNTITYNFKKPWTDFTAGDRLAAHSAPTVRTRTRATSRTTQIFSNGPYMLQGTWDKDKGGTFVRNPNWDPARTPIRKAYPDTDRLSTRASRPRVVDQRSIADSRQRQVRRHRSRTPRRRCCRRSGRTRPSEARRSPCSSPYVDYLRPNFKSGHDEPQGPQAFAVATDVTPTSRPAVATQADTPTHSMVQQGAGRLQGLQHRPGPSAGDPAKAKQLLQEAGVRPAVPDHVHLPERPDGRQGACGAQGRPGTRPASRSRSTASRQNLLRRRSRTRRNAKSTSSGPAGVPTGRPARPSSRRCSTAAPT